MIRLRVLHLRGLHHDYVTVRQCSHSQKQQTLTFRCNEIKIIRSPKLTLSCANCLIRQHQTIISFAIGARRNSINQHLLYKHSVYPVPGPNPGSSNSHPIGSIRHQSQDSPQPSWLKKYVTNHAENLIKYYDNKLQHHAPKAHKAYTQFMAGFRGFFRDTREYCGMSFQFWAGAPAQDFSRQQLQLYRQYPRDLKRTGITMIVSLVPFSLYAILPVALMFPRQLLSRHFWTEDQAAEFTRLELKKRLQHAQQLVKHLHQEGEKIPDPVRRRHFLQTLDQLSREEAPRVKDIIKNLHLFSVFPFHLERLSRKHRRLLSKACDVPTSVMALHNDVSLLQQVDLALLREGVHDLAPPDLRTCCEERGLYTSQLSSEEMKTFLSQWLQITSVIRASGLSLLLHSIVLVSLGAHSNKRLLHSHH